MWAGTVIAPVLGHLGGDRLDDLDIEIGGGELDAVALRLHQDIGQDRNGVAPLDHALHMVERLEKGRRSIVTRMLEHLSPSRAHVGPKTCGAEGAAVARRLTGSLAEFRYCCSISLISRATSRASRSSLFISSSILRTACRTVE